MNGKFLLDTNVVIGILERDHSVVRRVQPDMSLFLPSIVMGELFYGAHNSGRPRHNLSRLEALAQSMPVLSCDLGTATSYGKLKAELRKKGRPVPDNDIWIAAISEQKGLTLVTRDRHFVEFSSLSLQIW